MAGVRDWAEQRLRSLDFEGDANALAAYVDALAENNAEHEGGDLTKLRAEASSELSDFLGAQSSKAFVNDLVAYLRRLRGPISPPAPAAAGTPPHPPKPEPMLEVEEKPKTERTERSDRERERDRNRERSDRDRRSRRDRDRERDRERERERDRERDRIRDRERDRERERERDRDRGRGGGGMDWMRDGSSRDLRERGIGQSRRVGVGGGGGGGNTPLDLRNTLSRRRGSDGAQKRPREEAVGQNNIKQPRVDKSRSPTGVPAMMVPPGVPPTPGGPLPFFPPQMMMAMSTAPGGPAPDPAMFAQMQQMFAAQAQAAAAAAANAGSSGRGGNRGGRGGRGRGRGGRGGGGVGRENGSVSTSTSALIVRNIPEDKLNFGDLNSEFSKFGSITNIKLMPPGRAMLEFATRSQAQTAFSSVDAVFGNRHVKLNWARDQDSELGRKGGGGRTKSDTNGDSAGGDADMEDAETVLQRKRQEIKDARAEEERRKKAYEDAIVEQKQLFATLEGGSVEQKKKAFGRMKELDDLIKAHDAEKAARTQPPSPAKDKPWNRQRRVFPRHGPNAYTLDNRPKAVRITGANQGISPDAAAAIFRDTDRADAGPDGSWTLHFSTRAAAESAIRAKSVLRRGFGTTATAVIVKVHNNVQPDANPVPGAVNTSAPTPNPAPAPTPVGAPGNQ